MVHNIYLDCQRDTKAPLDNKTRTRNMFSIHLKEFAHAYEHFKKMYPERYEELASELKEPADLYYDISTYWE